MEKRSYRDNISYLIRVPFLSVILISLGLFIWLAINVKAGRIFWIDEEAFAITFALRNYFMNILMLGVTFLGSSAFLLPANIILIFVILIYKRDRLVALHWAVTASTSYLLMYFFKGMYQRRRPLDPYMESASGFSFPSGHTLNGYIFFGLLIFILWKFSSNKSFRVWGTILLIIIILAIGLSRIYLRVHYASDVLGGLALGTGWLMLTIYLFGLSGKRNSTAL